VISQTANMVLGHRKNSSVTSNSSKHDDGHGEDETVVSEEQGNVLMHIISQLRPGADLSRVTLPTFILEPKSMLERITNFMAHPETLLPIPDIDDPVKRFVAVTKFYLAGWHIKPAGVKKPLNPILGETFQGYWDYPDNTRGYYIAEQTSHHPPKSSYFFAAPEHHIRIDGTLKPRSKFLGNSVGSFMEGIAVLRLLNHKERYFVTQPNMYARGILFGKMKYELGDHAVVRCPESGLEASIEFKVKGWVSGTYNAIGGHISNASGKHLYELSGFWNSEMFIKDLSTGKKELLFDAGTSKPSPIVTRPLEEQGERESQRLWDVTIKAIKRADQRTATDDKSRIEEEQRKEAAERGGDENWRPRLFKAAPPGDEETLDWILATDIDTSVDAKKQTEQVLSIAPILPGQTTTSQESQPAQPTPSATTIAPTTTTIASQQPQPQAAQAQPVAPATTQEPAVEKVTAGVAAIDMGSHDGSSASVPLPADHPAAAPVRPTQSIIQPSNPSPGNPVRRTDTTGEEEEFVDAEG